MSEPLTTRQRLEGCVPARVLGRDVTLRFTMSSMAACEDHAADTAVSRLLTLTWACLLDEGISLAELGSSLDLSDMPTIATAVHQCMELSVPPAQPERAAKAKPKSDWIRLWSYASQELRLTDDRFWSLTPRQFAALSERHEEAYIRSLHGAAMITATLLNINRDPKTHPQAVKPADLLPQLAARDREHAEKVEAVIDVNEQSRRMFASLGARKVLHPVKQWNLKKRDGNSNIIG